MAVYDVAACANVVNSFASARGVDNQSGYGPVVPWPVLNIDRILQLLSAPSVNFSWLLVGQ